MSSRLASAVETLDTSKIQHASELAVEVEAKERLRTALARYVDVAKKAEATQDILRDVIVDLTNQVESSKDGFSSWPHSRIVMPCLLEPIKTMPSDLSSITSGSDLWSYASMTIVSLRGRLASECRAHAETRHAARARIAVLEARIAHRDAELEECIMHAGQTLPRASGSTRFTPDDPDLPPFPPPISISEVKALHIRKLAEKSTLEKEMEQLTEQLEKARLEANRVVLPSDTRQTVSEHVPRTLDQPLAGPSQPGRKKRNRQPNDAGHKIDSLRARSGSPARPPRPPSTSTGEQAVDPDRTIRPDTLRPAHTAIGEIESMNREIAALGAKIDEFRAEKEILAAQVQAESSPQIQGQQDGSNVHPKAPARPTSRRGKDILNEFGPDVQPWQSPQVFPPVPPPPEPGGPSTLAHLAPVQTQLFDDYDGSMSMELATPLVPTAVLPVAGPSTQPHRTGSSNFRFAPSPVPPPVSTEISPLDLSSDCPLPGVTLPVETRFQLQPGEQAVQELMDIAATAKRRA
ncbi:hypothetical protein B0H12DRAFT_1227631 [Mycena haematopus]|nr:hypothetical protein B0H12DRAFT_1227631 [Mycena haematopus]